MKNKIRLLLSIILSGVLFSVSFFTRDAYAYDYAMSGAALDGVLTVTEIPASGGANGYSALGGYRVDYTVNGPWTAYSNIEEGYFYTGDYLSASGGCHFCYAPSGTPWEQGAIALGCITGETVISRTPANEQPSFSCSYTVRSLSELKNYIAFAYNPAGGAYIHISDEFGPNYHVWRYMNLKSAPVNRSSSVDVTVPTISISAAPVGTSVRNNGVNWAQKARISVTASDSQARPESVRIYKNGVLFKTLSNSGNQTNFSTYVDVTENATYSAETTDKVGNVSARQSVAVNFIDLKQPVIRSITKSSDEFVKSLTISVSASDDGSGLHSSAYAFPNDGWGSGNTFETTENGTFVVRVRDALGNENQGSITVNNVDSTPPVIVKVDKEPIGEDKIKIIVTAKDNDGGSGLDEKAYSFDGGKTWQEENEFITDKNGEYEIVVRDKLEQTDDKKVTVSEIPEKKKDEKEKKDEGKDNKDNKNNDSSNDNHKDNTSDNKEDQSKENTDTSSGPNINDDPGSGPAPAASPDAGKSINENTKKKKNAKKKSNDNNEDVVSANTITDNNANSDENNKSVKKSKVKMYSEPEVLKSAPEDISDQVKVQTKKERSMPEKIAAALLIFIIAMALLGALLYLLLYYLRRSCELFGVDEKGRKEKLARLFIFTEDDGDFGVNVPDSKLGNLGTGDYAMTFSLSFLADHEGEDIIISIDGRKIRERIADEIRFFI